MRGRMRILDNCVHLDNHSAQKSCKAGGHKTFWRPPVSCKLCNSTNQSRFPAEIVVHFPGMKDLHRSQAWMFPSLLVCSHCGFTEFVIGKEELEQLRDAELYDEESGRAYGS